MFINYLKKMKSYLLYNLVNKTQILQLFSRNKLSYLPYNLVNKTQLLWSFLRRVSSLKNLKFEIEWNEKENFTDKNICFWVKKLITCKNLSIHRTYHFLKFDFKSKKKTINQ